jgi:signal transduction histidine kinase/CheY-like chemotaxis protein
MNAQMRERWSQLTARYLGSIAAIAAAVLLRSAFDGVLKDRLPFASVIATVAGIVWFAGVGPGIVATIMGYVWAEWLFVEPRHTLWIRTFDDVTTAVGYAVVSVSILVFGHLTRRARRHAEERLREAEAAKESLKESDRRKDEFLAMLGHELRNPLSPIHNALQVLNLVGGPDPSAVEARAIVERQVGHMSRLLDDLLDVSRIAHGKIRLKKEPCDLARIVRDTAEDYRSTLAESHLELRLDTPDLPLWVEGDPARLAQVVGNLLHNARKFSQPGGVVRVAVDRSDDGTYCLSVADTGIGIESSMLPRLFAPFVQADNRLDRSRGGLGVGLALVRGIVDLHGGQVSAESPGPGLGSRFTIRLPEAAMERPAAAPPAHPPAPDRSIRVLVIEDHADTANSLRMLLELSGHEAEAARTGAAGLEAARRFRPQVVFCDIGLPGMDGYEVARRLRQDDRLSDVYLVALTGYGQDRDRLQAQEAGFDLHMTKPIQFSALERTLAVAVSRQQAGDDPVLAVDAGGRSRR